MQDKEVGDEYRGRRNGWEDRREKKRIEGMREDGGQRSKREEGEKENGRGAAAGSGR